MHSYVTVTKGISGWFAVIVDWDDELEVYIPYTTGVGRYANREDAIEEAKLMAEMEGLPFTASRL
jgi:hypothetical protein